MRNALKAMIPLPVRESLRESLGGRIHCRRSYSQEGEDLVLGRMFDDRPAGVYVDVGAHHPFRFSNTCLLHERGWRGINIDACPGSMRLFRRFRPNDVNLEIGVSERPSRLEFFVFAEPALNTFDADLAKSRQDEGWAFVERIPVECRPLAQIIDEQLPRLGATGIDVLTIDAEGFDLQVLRSNDWDRYRPSAVVVEILGSDIGQMMVSPTALFLSHLGYAPAVKLHNSVVFAPANRPTPQ